MEGDFDFVLRKGRKGLNERFGHVENADRFSHIQDKDVALFAD